MGNGKVDEYNCILLQSVNGPKEIILKCPKRELRFTLRRIDNLEIMHFKWSEDPKII